MKTFLQLLILIYYEQPDIINICRKTGHLGLRLRLPGINSIYSPGLYRYLRVKTFLQLLILIYYEQPDIINICRKTGHLGLRLRLPGIDSIYSSSLNRYLRVKTFLQLLILFIYIQANRLLLCIQFYAQLRDCSLHIINIATKELDVGCSLQNLSTDGLAEIAQWLIGDGNHGDEHITCISQYKVSCTIPLAFELDVLPLCRVCYINCT